MSAEEARSMGHCQKLPKLPKIAEIAIEEDCHICQN